jgi:hypothetical protein
MRPYLALLSALALCLVVTPLPAQESTKKKRLSEYKLPVNPYSAAAVGDWSVLAVTKSGKELFRVDRVTSVSGDEVCVRRATWYKNGGENLEGNLTFSRKEAPSLDRFFDVVDGLVESVKVEDTKRTVSGKELACKEVTFVLDYQGKPFVTLTAYVSTDVKASGIVAMTETCHEEDFGGRVQTTTVELAGYGHFDKVLFGKRAADLGAGSKEDDAEGAAPTDRLSAHALPVNPFSAAEVGDWSVLSFWQTGQDGGKKVFIVDRVTSVLDNAVTVRRATWVDSKEAGEETRDFSKKEAPSLDRFFGIRDGPAEVTVKDAKRTVSGKDLACKEVEVRFVRDPKGAQVRITAYVSADVKASGIAAIFQTSLDLTRLGARQDTELAGYGHFDKVLLGKRAADLGAGSKEDDAAGAEPTTPLSSHKLPVNPFSAAEKGDWSVVAVAKSGKKLFMVDRVTGVSGDEVNVSRVVWFGGMEAGEETLTFSRKEAPSLDRFFGLIDIPVGSVKVEDAKRTVCGKELACKEVSFAIGDPGKPLATFTACVSADVKASGIVAMTQTSLAVGHIAGHSETVKQETELAGYGHFDKVLLGKRAADLGAGEKEDDAEVQAEQPTRLPWNPYAKATEGDWEVLVGGWMGAGGTLGDHQTFVARIAKLAGDTATVAIDNRHGDGGEHSDAQTHTCPTKGDLLISALSELPAPLKRVRIAEDEKLTVAGREFACTRVSFAVSQGEDRVQTTIWLSKEVKGSGIVARTTMISQGGEGGTFREEIAGFGSRDKTEWGKSVEQTNADTFGPAAAPPKGR